MEKEVDKKSTFLEKIKSENMKKVVGARITQLEKKDKKEKRKSDLAEITKDLLDSEYVDLGDTSLTIGDMLVATATANMIENPRTGFKEINDAQKVIDGNINADAGKFTVIINTNGQDLGDEV